MMDEHISEHINNFVKCTCCGLIELDNVEILDTEPIFEEDNQVGEHVLFVCPSCRLENWSLIIEKGVKSVRRT